MRKWENKSWRTEKIPRDHQDEWCVEMGTIGEIVEGMGKDRKEKVITIEVKERQEVRIVCG